MRVSNYCLGKIKEFEGYRAQAYKDSAGVWTIGYGHTRGVERYDRTNPRGAEMYLREDLAPVERYLQTVPELDTQGKFDACADFCFNLGMGAFKASTLLRHIKAGRTTAEIQAQFRRWVYAGGRILNGLVKRRAWEAERWAD